MTDTIKAVTFDYFKNNKALRNAVCVLMREFGTISIDGCESDDEAMDRYLADEDGEVELHHFRIIGNEILGCVAAIEAMQIREMTVEEVAEITYNESFGHKNILGELISKHQLRTIGAELAKELAKLGCIRIVGEV